MKVKEKLVYLKKEFVMWLVGRLNNEVIFVTGAATMNLEKELSYTQNKINYTFNPNVVFTIEEKNP